MRTVISYDISSDKRRNRIVKILEGYGYRVQYSVFECDLTPKMMGTLRRRLKPYVRAEQNESVRIYPLHQDSVAQIHVIGKDLRKELGPVVVV